MKLLLALLLFSSGITQEEIVKLKKAGISDETIVKLIDADNTVFSLGADDLIRLRKEGLSDRLLQHMISTSKEAPASEGKGLQIENLSAMAVRVYVDSKARTVEFNGSRGTTLSPKSSREWDASPGTYRVLKDGKAYAYRFDAPNRISLRGGKVGDMEIITAYIEKAPDRDTFLVHLKENKPAPAPVLRYRAVPTYPSYSARPRRIHDHRTGNRMLMGAGIGAIIGYQSDHAWEGALIGGGAGLLLDQYLKGN